MPTRATQKHFLSIIMPAYNEEETISEAVSKTLAQNYGVPFELITINDGSTDSTLDKLRKFSSRVQIISSKKNNGKGYAIRTGLARAKGSIAIIQDADLEYDPKQIRAVIQPILDSRAEAVYGSRFSGSVQGMSLLFSFGNKLLTLATNLLFNSRLTDMETCYKALSRTALSSLELSETSFTVEAEITAKLLKRGFSILEVPIAYKARSQKQGKKIKIADGLKTILTLLKIRFL
ncbi:glycosyltransferase family 2 protein [Candidatus Micrarchaeota archaeon]|nr:glycosyltransferase family 2 protein [Candidatus Micrarchaeota archaeon]